MLEIQVELLQLLSTIQWKKKQSDNYDIYLRGVLSFSARMYVFFRSIFQLPNKSKEIYY